MRNISDTFDVIISLLLWINQNKENHGVLKIGFFYQQGDKFIIMYLSTYIFIQITDGIPINLKHFLEM